MKSVEDQLDAVMAAYVGAHYWRYGLGFMVVPRRRQKAGK
jgi:predicted RNase H-like nuclease